MRYRYDVYALGGGGAAAFKPGCTDRITLLRLTGAERERIGAVAERSGFFGWPRNLRELPAASSTNNRLEEAQIASACASGELELSRHGQRHAVHWDCNTAAELNQKQAEAPQQIRALLDAIREAFAAHAEFAAARANQCKFE